MSATRLRERRRGLPSHSTYLITPARQESRLLYLPLPPCRPGSPGTPPSSSLDRLGSPWFELPGSQPSGPLPTPWLHFSFPLPWRLAWLPGQPTRFVSVIVTAAPAKASPLKVPRVMVMAAPARIVPKKCESVIVAAWATHQVTLQGAVAPPLMTTEKLVPVRAPVPLVPILKIQTPVEGPLRVNVLPVDVAAALMQ